MSRALALAVVALCVTSCGRSSPDVSCPAVEGLVCDDLAKLRVSEATAYAAAVGDGDAVGASDAGTCDASVVDLQLQRSCIADRCGELCALAPCAVVGDGDCATTCAGLALGDDVLDTALLRAAAAPGFCSCNVCVDDAGKRAKDGTEKLCTDLFVCPSS